ncbi:hypothetical protein CBL_12413 [Carabus blaptoides fortunei]
MEQFIVGNSTKSHTLNFGNLQSSDYCANRLEKPRLTQIVNLQIPRLQQQEKQHQAREKSQQAFVYCGVILVPEIDGGRCSDVSDYGTRGKLPPKTAAAVGIRSLPKYDVQH